MVTKYRQLGIPGSVFVFDSPWETAYNDFTWNLTQFGSSPAHFDPAEWRRMRRLARASYAMRIGGSLLAELQRAR